MYKPRIEDTFLNFTLLPLLGLDLETGHYEEQMSAYPVYLCVFNLL